ncbi:MAG: EpsI family protein [Deltaproteobacteria bacterium]|nr:EpsI family protein [Deltaproteobacteria bacterium]
MIVYKSIARDPSNQSFHFKNEFPSHISDWSAKDVLYDKAVIASLDPDVTVYKTYYKNDLYPVTLFIAGYHSLEKADLSHSPIVCFTGQGWDIIDTRTNKISMALDNEIIYFNQMVQKKAETTMITFFWYQTKTRSFSNRGLQKFYLFFQRLIGKSDYNAFVRLTATNTHDESLEETMLLLIDFAKELYPELRRHFL